MGMVSWKELSLEPQIKFRGGGGGGLGLGLPKEREKKHKMAILRSHVYV